MNLMNAVDGDFRGGQIVCVSEIGLPSDHVIPFANELCSRLNLSVFRQEAEEKLPPVGDEDGLFILPVTGRIWHPITGAHARALPILAREIAHGREWEVRGVPYEVGWRTTDL